MTILKPASFLLILLTFSIVSCSSDEAGNTPEPPVEVLPADSMINVSYGSHVQQVYDIYLPEDRSSEYTKVVLLVHGGSWIGGDKADMQLLIPPIREKYPDHAIVNMNYVLATEETKAFPHQFLDINKVIDQLTERKEELQILPEFALIGVSAGAHLSLQYDYVYDEDDQVKMVCSIVGPTNMTDPFYVGHEDYEILYPVLIDEGAYPEGTNYLAAISPALHVSPASSPTIMFYGNEDKLVPLSNPQLLESELTKYSIPHELTIYNGGHGIWDQASYEDMEVKLANFIGEHLEVAIPAEWFF